MNGGSERRRVLITGASRGIGRGLATELSARGHSVIATARNPDDLADLDVDERLHLDVTDSASVAEALAATGKLDVIVNNAGATITGPTALVTVEQVNTLFDVNTLGALRVAQAAGEVMRERGNGMILQISSIAAGFTPPLQGAYAASKAALERLSHALRFELAPFGISVGVVVVGAAHTGFADRAHTVSDPAFAGLVTQQRKRQEQHAERSSSAPSVAARVADVVERDQVPGRTYVGGTIERVFALLPSAVMTRLSHSGLDWSN